MVIILFNTDLYKSVFPAFLMKNKNISPLSGLMCVLFWTPFHIHKLIAFVFFINSTKLWSKDVFMILRNIFSLHQANKKHQLQIYLLVTSTFGCNARRDNSESSFWCFSKRVLNFNYDFLSDAGYIFLSTQCRGSTVYAERQLEH